MPATIRPDTLRAFRQARGWSLDELSDRSGVSKATLKRIEAAREPYKANGVGPKRLANALNVPVEDLGRQFRPDIASVAAGPFVEIRFVYYRHEMRDGVRQKRYVGTNVPDGEWDEISIIPEHVGPDLVRMPTRASMLEEIEKEKARRAIQAVRDDANT
ncbi:helix-turn-helix transcriptional regulator [Novosphingobium flavum]|uniref:Helix-turn-helix transcriptional regulator n=1 Tax=Novosphingobium flavum TaxID=1778672 RepID=A0A7X1FSJ2_9SPHN|nr:helix-turn-helix transcriptional regulator [Novosphingobium flavum]MBC2666054.1 helix-turn-helix transcriptional regulator [Novosphingobium flavum]